MAYNSGIQGELLWNSKGNYLVILAGQSEHMDNEYLIAENIYVVVKDGQLSGIIVQFCSDNRIYYTGIKKEKINTQSWDIWCYDKDLIIADSKNRGRSVFD